RLEDATVVHYHRAFYGTAWWRDIPVGEPYATWLRRRLPLPGLHERLRQSRTLRRSLRYVRGLSTVAMRLRARHGRAARPWRAHPCAPVAHPTGHRTRTPRDGSGPDLSGHLDIPPAGRRRPARHGETVPAPR